ncbi:neurotrophin-3-like [Myxocyprinus asiaticus]|uniref:neurotrophin-3-like n=1 Tax=Myxocyprinus asiaticus TaxID=70543 RepID=UPI002222EFC6|nr:neurotrophin-3-like [Myxocyprinus asiaticus]
MVTFITILQVNLVMSILLYVMFLAYLYGISASTMDKQRPTQDPINMLIIKLLQADISRSRQKQDEGTLDALPSITLNTPAVTDYKGKLSSPAYQPVTDISSELLRQHKRYNSPRVLLSDRPPLQPPPHYLMDDFVSSQDASGSNKTRQKRYAEHKSYRAEYSVCDSISEWVVDRTTAVDIRGQQVTVLGNINAGRTDLKQYFFETKCRTAKPFKGGCRGIDEKHWNSQCKTSQTYVRALTQDKSSVGWRWIRIDTSCVCALSRKHRRT